MSASNWKASEWRLPERNGSAPRIIDYGPGSTGVNFFLHSQRGVLATGSAPTLEEAQTKCEAALAKVIAATAELSVYAFAGLEPKANYRYGPGAPCVDEIERDQRATGMAASQ